MLIGVARTKWQRFAPSGRTDAAYWARVIDKMRESNIIPLHAATPRQVRSICRKVERELNPTTTTENRK